MKNIIVIPARGGSKGIPNKNLQLVGGITLIERAIKFSSFVSELVFVSSDSDSILEIAKENGVGAIKRPLEISGDFASSESSVLHVLAKLNDNGDAWNDTDKVTLLQCTSPFQDIKAFRVAEELIANNKADSIFSAEKVFPFVWELSDREYWRPLNHPIESRPMRQELGETAIETGAFYMSRLKSFMAHKSRFSGRVMPVFVEFRYNLDIDTPEQLEDATKRALYVDKTLRYLGIPS